MELILYKMTKDNCVFRKGQKVWGVPNCMDRFTHNVYGQDKMHDVWGRKWVRCRINPGVNAKLIGEFEVTGHIADIIFLMGINGQHDLKLRGKIPINYPNIDNALRQKKDCSELLNKIYLQYSKRHSKWKKRMLEQLSDQRI